MPENFRLKWLYVAVANMEKYRKVVTLTHCEIGFQWVYEWHGIKVCRIINCIKRGCFLII